MARRLRALVVAAMCITAMAGFGVTGAAADPGQTPPPRNNSSDETVYLVKGFNSIPLSDGVSCQDRWGRFTQAMQSWGWKGTFVKVGFYTGDDCDINLARTDGTRDLPLEELGRRLAWNIYLNYSRYGKSVDLVGHSMGGLIVRAAVHGVTHRPSGDWPPFIYVEDAVTLGAPHYGVAARCRPDQARTRQCLQMNPGSSFLNWLHSARVPQSAQRTDWTFIGTNADDTVSRDSATPRTDGAQHLVRYAKSEGIGHSQLRELAHGTKKLYYSNNGRRWVTSQFGAAPVRAAGNALYWQSRW
ncbi:hypothetical protein [Streptomyces sp. NPDC005322]|uniref:PGAP1-like alpha/beta domain-containing protein n=1 Tax=Streptomyces sp. NPDC005322 TaxID=3157032 RepID=UPI0033BECB70